MTHNVQKYYGNNKPSWTPNIFSNVELNVDNITYFEYPNDPNYLIYQFDHCTKKHDCNQLINQFEEQVKYPVGIDGFCDPNSRIGSYRAMAWEPDIVKCFHNSLWNDKIFQEVHNPLLTKSNALITDDGRIFKVPFKPKFYYNLLGSTPWLRFMKYHDGGMHTPHYDAPYKNSEENYITLFSWVLYLNTPKGSGGEFQFVNDIRNKDKHPKDWDRSDWTEMSDDILLSIEPKQGRLLIFPHWLCHQVAKFHGMDDNDARYIIRGDLAYGF